MVKLISSRKKSKIRRVMREYKAGRLKSGRSGQTVQNPKQAIAIALSVASRRSASTSSKKAKSSLH